MSLVRRPSWTILGVVAAMLIVACSSKTNSDDDDDDGGEGGGGGSGGSSAKAGTGGTSGTGAKGGSSGTGGTSGTGGSLSAKCTTMCDKGQSAACPNFDHAACVGTCADVTAMDRDTTECSADWIAYFDCVNALSDVCDAGDETAPACESQLLVGFYCMLNYCESHTTASYCQ
jgi:hypothetical protein